MSDPPCGIATFPSFHATVAILTPLTLRGYPRIFVALLISASSGRKIARCIITISAPSAERMPFKRLEIAPVAHCCRPLDVS
jgi:hypothetical protein